MYTLQVVWNRSFYWSDIKNGSDLEILKSLGRSYMNMSEGEAVKKARIIQSDNEKVVVPYIGY